MTNNFSVPILLIAFNRPEETQQVFEQIRKARPKHLFLAFDGPRVNRPNEELLCKQCRSIIDKVDWDCNLHTLIRDNNVGCGLGPSNAISWAFKFVDKLIVLEDDCFPSLSFFPYCQELLELYENDKRIWLISGLSIHQNSAFFADKDYIFSRYAHTWGWATWKDRWDEFDLYMQDVPDFIAIGGALNVYDSKKVGKRCNDRYLEVYNNINEEIKHSWDTQWAYTRTKNGGLGIIPKINLIENIGDKNGTHAMNNAATGIKTGTINFPMCHPKFVLQNKTYDRYHYCHYIHRDRWLYLFDSLKDFQKFKQLLSSILKKIGLLSIEK